MKRKIGRDKNRRERERIEEKEVDAVRGKEA